MMESDARFFRRRAAEETAAADRAITPAARERRLQLAQSFLVRLAELEKRSAFAIADPVGNKRSAAGRQHA